ncbi:MAG: Ca-activated chloride channel family protein [Paraglaciecola sp.]
MKEVADLKYSSKKGTDTSSQNELFTVKFSYKKPLKAKSIDILHVQNDEIVAASNDFKFASAVALFGMKLRKSQYYNHTEKKVIIKLAENGKREDKDGYRAEFIRLVKSI